MEITKLMRKNEIIYWEGTPIFYSKSADLINIIIISDILCYIILISLISEFQIFFVIFIFLIIFLLFYLLIQSIFYLSKRNKNKNTLYLITNQRIIIVQNQKLINFINVTNLLKVKIYSNNYVWFFEFYNKSNESKNNPLKFDGIIDYLEIKKVLNNLISLKGEIIGKSIIFNVLNNNDKNGK